MDPSEAQVKAESICLPGPPHPKVIPMAPAIGEWCRPDRKVILSWTVKAYTVILLAFLIFVIPAIYTVLGDLEMTAGAILPVAIVLIIFAYLPAVAWATLTYRNYAFLIDGTAVHIRMGLLWRRISHLRYERIQHTTVTRGPLEILLGLHSVSIFTAGTSSTGAGFAPGLNMKAAEGYIPGLLDPAPIIDHISSMIGSKREYHTKESEELSNNLQESILGELRSIREDVSRIRDRIPVVLDDTDDDD